MIALVLLFVVCLAVGVGVGLLVAVATSERWPEKRVEVERCEVCSLGLTRDEVHRLTTTFDDDAHLAGSAAMGTTGMSAYYCADHCPGGCQRERMAA